MSESVKVPFRYLVRPARCVRAFQIAVLAASVGAVSAKLNEAELADKFTTQVRPFVENYCVKCHDQETRKGDLDLSPFTTMDSVVKDFPHWELVLERLQNGEMPPAKSKQQPSEEIRKGIVDWIQDFRQVEARKYAGDPGPVLPRRLSNAEYDYTIRDLTGVDLNPTRAFPVDPANQAGFNNSGESLAMSPALVKKYFEAAREVADHLALLPDGFAFAPHPVVADTDRDKWSVFRIVNFYKQQPTDYADYFFAAWHYQNRKNLGMPDVSLAEIAAQSKVSSKYLSMVWATLAGTREEIGPIAKLQSMWRELPEPRDGSVESVRAACDEMREYVVRIRQEIVPQVPNLNAPPFNLARRHWCSGRTGRWPRTAAASIRPRSEPRAV